MALITEDLIEGRIDKVAIAIDRIRSMEKSALSRSADGFHVAFSGGKDSVCVLDLVKASGVKYTAHYNQAPDPPELIQFIKKFTEVTISRPPENIWKLIEKNGPPLRNKRFCCRLLKEGNGEGIIITGIRWEESERRRKRDWIEPCFRDSHKFYLNPIIDWSSKDVWEYIHANKLDYCSLYNEGFKRLGCVGCPNAGAKGMLRQFGRWPKIKSAYIRSFDRYIQYRISRGKQPVQLTGQEMFDWWIKEVRKRVNPDQTIMFE